MTTRTDSCTDSRTDSNTDSRTDSRTATASSQDLKLRLVNCLPGASFELEKLIGLTEISETTEVATAAITAGLFPRLLINPHFVEQYCKTDEHLFLLTMHELWHVLRGHTRLYSTLTQAHNIAFDAIINAGLARQFPGPAYRGFFEVINSTEQFPSRLLCPPQGWPHNPDYSGAGPARTESVLRRLYPPFEVKVIEPTYNELLDLLGGSAKEDQAAEQHAELPEESAWDPVVLLGDHSSDSINDSRISDGPLGDLLQDVAERWPTSSLGTADLGGNKKPVSLTEQKSNKSDISVIESVLRRACRPAAGGHRLERIVTERSLVTSPLPAARDRQRLARSRLGVRSVLWNNEVEHRRQSSEWPATAKVYLDVSGSMNNLLPLLIGPITKFVASGFATASQFSTIVLPLSLAELQSGQLTTTGGTDMNCVFEDALLNPFLRSIVVLTDGYINPPPPKLLQKVRAQGITIEAIIGKRHPKGYLAPFSTVTRLESA
ncbi:MAG: hypothetical protein WD029_01895 [Microthrixaceae bacterium]